MRENKKNCFAYKELSNVPRCNALKELNCTNCPFYKDKKDIKDNIFYEESFENYREFIKALERYSNKYGTGHLVDFEEE